MLVPRLPGRSDGLDRDPATRRLRHDLRRCLRPRPRDAAPAGQGDLLPDGARRGHDRRRAGSGGADDPVRPRRDRRRVRVGSRVPRPASSGRGRRSSREPRRRRALHGRLAVVCPGRHSGRERSLGSAAGSRPARRHSPLPSGSPASSTAGPMRRQKTPRSGSTADPLTLIDAPRCPYCARVRIVLAEKGVEYETVVIDLADRPAWLYELNPSGKVPVIQEDGWVLPESAVINEYLEERYPEPPLLPADPAARAAARLLIFRHDDFTRPYYALRREREGAEAEFAEALAVPRRDARADPVSDRLRIRSRRCGLCALADPGARPARRPARRRTRTSSRGSPGSPSGPRSQPRSASSRRW